MMVLECLARAWVVPSPDNVLSSILKKMPKIQLRAGDRTIPLLIEEVNHRFMRVNIICMLQKRWKDLEFNTNFRKNDKNRDVYRQFVRLMHKLGVPSLLPNVYMLTNCP